MSFTRASWIYVLPLYPSHDNPPCNHTSIHPLSVPSFFTHLTPISPVFTSWLATSTQPSFSALREFTTLSTPPSAFHCGPAPFSDDVDCAPQITIPSLHNTHQPLLTSFPNSVSPFFSNLSLTPASKMILRLFRTAKTKSNGVNFLSTCRRF
ncbi:hypothetical protein SAICODRAFT_104379 [Saitoella complicata NRRL Y-17804]|uniref:uncharacterized protein n=1 Tax=Saitoella complicata (strain BCRC 22490 / CBS 7301 / JCM 7358 / NBRC 10748 / NRRL Y-17804) TaxID=698492 RepID=UPI000867C8AC|nr:uncharacterized protein SAICODRAFT_104379 [Saitoella complicata NRRL Y-17804]ODQ56215.1 hypothetical protein SAICODRAFT_104379 [Saitoella complicata NRRL Y-17804]